MGTKFLVKDGHWRRVTDAWLRQQAERMADLERRVAELEARPVYPVYPIYPQPCDPPNPWVWPLITWTYTSSSNKAGD